MLCVCVCDRARRSEISSGLTAERSIVILVRYVLKKGLQKVRRGPERVVAEEYGVLIRAKAGAGRYKRQRKETDRDETQLNNTTREERDMRGILWCATHSRKCAAAGRMKRRGR